MHCKPVELFIILVTTFLSAITSLTKTLIEIRDACDRLGNICAKFSVSGVPSMSRLYVYIKLSLDSSGILIDIVLTNG